MYSPNFPQHHKWFYLKLPLRIWFRERTENRSQAQQEIIVEDTATANISSGGCYFYLRYTPMAGTDAEMEITVPAPGARGKENKIRCWGKILRVEEQPSGERVRCCFHDSTISNCGSTERPARGVTVRKVATRRRWKTNTMISWTRFFCLAFLLSFVSLLLPKPASAQEGAGFRFGASVDPDQFYFGGHLGLGPLVEQLWFRPNVEVGIGNNRTLVGFNGEFTYWFPLARQPWSVYVGAGPALNLIRFDADSPRGGDTEAEGGFNILVGLAHRRGLFAEIKVGALHSPEFKLGIGYTFQ